MTLRKLLILCVACVALGVAAFFLWAPRSAEVMTTPVSGKPLATASSLPPANTPDSALPNIASPDEVAQAQRFPRWIQNWYQDIPALRSSDTSQAQQMAQAYRRVIASLIPTRPGEAVSKSVNPGLRGALPADVEAQLDQRVDAMALVFQGSDGTWAAVIDGKKYRAFFAGPAPASGTTIPVVGVAVGDLLAVSATPWRFVEPGEADHDESRVQILRGGERLEFPSREALDAYLSSHTATPSSLPQ